MSFNTLLKLGIIGNGFVGKASRTLANKNVQILSYDLDPKLCIPEGTTLEDIGKCDIVFVSVPTPMNSDGSVHLKIVESVVESLKKVKSVNTQIVIRSTIPPGTSERLGTYFMPEFLTEANYISDFINCDLWVFGLVGNQYSDEEFKVKISYIFNSAKNDGKIMHSNIKWLTNTEAEMVKYFRNTYLATKVSFCNEIYKYCTKIGVNYDNVRLVACSDKRIGLSHTDVPGPDKKFGYGGTCFPKDTNGLYCEMKKHNTKPLILGAVIKRNEEIDRSEKDWNSNIGRSVI